MPSAQNNFYSAVVYSGPLHMQRNRMAHIVNTWIWMDLQSGYLSVCQAAYRIIFLELWQPTQKFMFSHILRRVLH